MATTRQSIIDFEQGWDFIQKGIKKLKNILEGLPETEFTPADLMMLFTTVYRMSTQNPPHDYSVQLYDKYRESFVEYITSTVMPSLREKHGDFMLRELLKRWSNHKMMVQCLSKIFRYLDRYYGARRSLPSVEEVGMACFRDLVYLEIKGEVRDAVISLIDRERQGEQIDRDLVKNVINIFIEIGEGQMDYYENDFEKAMLKDTAAYYSWKSSNWMLHDSCPQYMFRAEECLEREKDRVSRYLHSSTETKLLEGVQHELLFVYATRLLENEHSGCDALLRYDKVEDLSRMYRLFSKIPRGLDPVANIFKQHVTAQATSLVKEAQDAASNKKVIVRKVIDKFMAYVNDCFQNDALFHKALKEGFEVLSGYKGVAAEIEAIEESLEMMLLEDDEAAEKMLLDE